MSGTISRHLQKTDGMVLAVLILMTATCPSGDGLRVLFWNLENFFDWKDGGYSDSDKEFSSRGERHWTWKRYNAKCNAVAKTIMWIGDREGRMPDIVAVAEVESRKVLMDLAQNTPMRKSRYGVVHYESPDRRGIDVGLLYRKDSLHLARSVPIHITGFETRDILLCSFVRKGGDTLHILVNHHPSKWGGTAAEGRRKAAIARLIALGDSLARAGDSLVVAMGDFNDTPENPLYGRLCREGRLVNLAESPARHGQGTIRYNGRWELIDQLYVSPALASAVCRTPSGQGMEILRIPFLLVRDAVHSGEKPFRTWSGPRYIGGVSDHLPVALQLRTPKESENDNRTQQPGRMPPG